MPTSKRVSTRPQSPAHSEGSARAKTTANGTNPLLGERISTRGWSVESLLELGEGNFEAVERVSVRKMPPQRIVEVVRKYEGLGRPLILEEWHLRTEWNEAILDVDYLVGRLPDQELSTRNIHNRSDKTTTLKEYIDYSRALPQFTSKDEAERYYGKDALVPPAWAKWLADAIPEPIQALGSGDIMSYLKESDRPETLMCYFGVGDTYTPAHKDLCASVGHNLLTYSENNGSAFWFLSSTGDADKASGWFHGMNEELDLETHLATVDEWVHAPFKVYICQQQLGDLILVPKRSCHQVINHGGLNLKTSWSRMSIDSLELSLDIELSIYRRVCRAEVHRVRLNVWEALKKCTELIQSSSAEEVKEETELLRRLIPMFSKILAEEFDPDLGSHERILRKGESIHVVCDCCGGDIFQSFFRCLSCTPPTANSRIGLALCPGCYCEGRTCLCGSEIKMQPCQMRDFKLLLMDRSAASQILRNAKALKKPKASISNGSDLLELKHAPLFRLANRLLQIRSQTPKKTRKCNMHRRSGLQHAVAFDNARTCEQCHSALCYKHILESFGIHCTELWWKDITENPKSVKYMRWHEKHMSQIGSVAEASFNIVSPEVEAQIGWAQYLARLAWKYQDCHPISDHVRVGWYDPQILNVDKPKYINTRDPEFSPSIKEAQRKRHATSIGATPSRIQAKRNAAKDVVYIDDSSDEIAASVSERPAHNKDKGKKRRITDSEDSDCVVVDRIAPKRRKVETKKGVYKLDIPVHVHVPRRRPTTATQSDSTSRDALDILWNDDDKDRTTEPSEVQSFPPRPAPKSKQRPRRSATKATITVPHASSFPGRTRSKAVPGSVQGPPTPLSDSLPAFIPTSILLPASKSDVPPFDLTSFKAEVRAEVTAAVAAQFVGIREEIFMMRASIEALGQNGDEPRLAEIEAREAVLIANEEEYERLKSKETELANRLALLDTRYQEVEQGLMEKFATNERELLERISGTQPRTQDQVDIIVDREAEELELLAQEISAEGPTNYEVSIQEGEPFEVIPQLGSIVPLRVLKPQDSNILPTDEGFNSGGDGNDASIVPMINEEYELRPGLDEIPGAHSSVKPAESQTTSGSLMRGPAAIGYAIDLQISKPTNPADSDEDAEADIDAEEVGNSVFADPSNEP